MGRNLNGAEALMWALDADPALRSSFMGITFVDRLPDGERFRRRMAEAIDANPVLKERVVSTPFDIAPPRWEPDPDFDLAYHVRHVALPPPGDRRQLLDLAALIYADPFDRSRPLWQFTMVEGLADGGAALLAKMHHVISDGVGAVRLSVSFLDLSPDETAMHARRPAAPEASESGSWFHTAAGALAPIINTVVRAPADGVAFGVSTARSLASLGRQVGITDPARSPLWADKHTMGHRFDTLSIELDALKSVAGSFGGTVNDAFVTVMAGAAGAYHRAFDADVDELRMAMPISVRTDKDAGGNAFVPVRVLVPAASMPVRDRFDEVHERLTAVKKEPSLGLSEGLAGLLWHLPTPLLARFAKQQTGTVDFACSNVRGAPFDLWVSGGRVVANHPMGPTAGVAFNATVLSYRGSLDLGLHTDGGAVSDPDLLVRCVQDSVDELLAAAS